MYHLGLRGSEVGRGGEQKGVSDTGRLSIHGIMLAAQGVEFYLYPELMVLCHEERGQVCMATLGPRHDEVKAYLFRAI